MKIPIFLSVLNPSIMIPCVYIVKDKSPVLVISFTYGHSYAILLNWDSIVIFECGSVLTTSSNGLAFPVKF